MNKNFRRLSNPFKNIKGQTITEFLISSGVTAIIVLIISTVLYQITEVIQVMLSKNDLEQLVYLTNLELKKNPNCSNILKNNYVYKVGQPFFLNKSNKDPGIHSNDDIALGVNSKIGKKLIVKSLTSGFLQGVGSQKIFSLKLVAAEKNGKGREYVRILGPVVVNYNGFSGIIGCDVNAIDPSKVDPEPPATCGVNTNLGSVINLCQGVDPKNTSVDCPPDYKRFGGDFAGRGTRYVYFCARDTVSALSGSICGMRTLDNDNRSNPYMNNMTLCGGMNPQDKCPNGYQKLGGDLCSDGHNRYLYVCARAGDANGTRAGEICGVNFSNSSTYNKSYNVPCNKIDSSPDATIVQSFIPSATSGCPPGFSKGGGDFTHDGNRFFWFCIKDKD